MNKEQKFLNNSYVNETKFGYLLKLDKDAIDSLEVLDGKYYISMNKNKNGQGWHMTEADWAKKDAGKFTKPTTRIEQTVAMLPKDDVWSKAKDWQVKNQPNGDFTVTPTVDTDDLPF